MDLASIHDEDGRSKEASKRQRSARNSLVAEGKLLRAAIVCQALGMTKQLLAKDVAASRIINVVTKADEFYPAFFLAKDLIAGK